MYWYRILSKIILSGVSIRLTLYEINQLVNHLQMRNIEVINGSFRGGEQATLLDRPTDGRDAFIKLFKITRFWGIEPLIK